MNNPNELYKFNNKDDPLDECTTLQEYILDLVENLSSCIAAIDSAAYANAKDYAIKSLDIAKEMGQGDWRITIDEEEDKDKEV